MEEQRSFAMNARESLAVSLRVDEKTEIRQPRHEFLQAFERQLPARRRRWLHGE